MKAATYKNAGVDILASAVFKAKISGIARKSFSSHVLKGIGGFGSFFGLALPGLKDPVLVSSADGVGTKLKIAFLVNKHDSVGIDAVAMNVNDILCTGAKPLFFLDYIAHTNARQEVLISLVKGLNRGCIEAGCALIGGETAQMPDFYQQGEYDLAGFCVGIVKRQDIIDGSKIKVNDILIGLESNGLHSNGYSLVRKVFSQKELRRLSPELLRPTRIYAKPVMRLLRINQPRSNQPAVSGIAHITGGAFYDKIARILPGALDAVIDKTSWNVPRIFRLIQEKGGIKEREMYHTLNMGIGMVLVARPQAARSVQSNLNKSGLRNWVIGEVIRGRKEVIIA
jgi:phosphoribosylformylglycinamidine cyclo-ligase